MAASVAIKGTPAASSSNPLVLPVTWDGAQRGLIGVATAFSSSTPVSITVTGGGVTWSPVTGGVVQYRFRRGMALFASDGPPSDGDITITGSADSFSFQEHMVAVAGVTDFDSLGNATSDSDGLGTGNQATPGDIGTLGANDIVVYFGACENGSSDVRGDENTVDGVDLAQVLGGANVRSIVMGYTPTDSTVVVDYNGSGIGGAAIALHIVGTAGGEGDPTITDLDDDEVITEGQTGATFTCANAGENASERTLTLIQGATSVTQTQQSGDADGGTFDVVIGALMFGAITARVTRLSDDDFGEIAATLNPAAGQLYVDLTSVHGTSSERITAIPDLEVGWQLWARGVGGGAAPTGLFLNADGTFGFTSGNPEQDFEVAANDGTGYGDFAVQSVGGAVTNRTLTDSVLVTDTDGETRSRSRQMIDVMSTSDLVSMIRMRSRLRSEEIVLADALTDSHRALIRSVQDDVFVADEAITLRDRLRSLLDVLESVDSLVVSGQTGAVITSRVLSDNASIADVFDALSLRYRVIQDELSVLDTLVLGAGDKKRILEDVLSVTDASLRYLLAVRLSQSLVTASDDLALGRVLGRTAQDEASLSDETLGKRALGRSAEDTILSDDSSSQRRLRDRVTQDEIDAVDAVIANYITEIFNSLVLYGLEIRDIVVGLEDLNIVTDISQEIG